MLYPSRELSINSKNKSIESMIEMLNTSTLTSQRYLKVTRKDAANVKPLHKKPPPREKPKHEDTLFWCFYVLWKGVSEYNMITSTYFKVENESKYMIASELVLHKAILKRFRISYSDVENSLINEKKISLGCFMVLCRIYKINVIVINKRFYIAELENNLNDESANIIMNDKEVFAIDYSSTLTPGYIKDNFIEMHSANKVLKCITAYKLQELQDMCFRVNIDINQPNGKKKTKTDLYTEITVFLNN